MYVTTSATLSVVESPKPAPRRPRRITREQFLLEYAAKEDGYKYEWVDGIIEKTSATNQQQATMQNILLRLFIKTKTFQEGGLFTAETEMDTLPSRYRRPDLAIYTAEQLPLMKEGKNQIAPWVAEVISPTDNADAINTKLEEYFRVGVQVVWQIYPASQMVYVYTSPDDVVICRGKKVCSAAPALPDFEIAAEELF